MTEGTDRAYELAKKHGVPLAWGTDTLFDAQLALRQGAQLAKMVRWFEPAEVLKMATADNAALLALSGPRNPYPGKLGVVGGGRAGRPPAARRRPTGGYPPARRSRGTFW